MAWKRAGEGILPAILLPCIIGIGFPSFQGHCQIRGCDVPPALLCINTFPAQTLCFPQNSFPMCCSHPPCLILPASNCQCFRVGKVFHCLLSMGCGKLLLLNKLQFLPKIITVMGQELGALLIQGIVFACVKKGWGQQLPRSLSATGQW